MQTRTKIVNAATFFPQPGFSQIQDPHLRLPRFFNADLAAIKKFKVGERLSFMFRAEFFNAFNNVNLGLPGNQLAAGTSGGFARIGGTAGAGAYGGPTSYGTAQPRIIQFGLKASF